MALALLNLESRKERFAAMSSFPNHSPPYPKLDPLECKVEHLAANLRATREYLAQTSISGAKGKTTSMAPINDVVQNAHITTLASQLRTKFADHPDNNPPDQPLEESGNSPAFLSTVIWNL
jgi:hypothetical protein